MENNNIQTIIDESRKPIALDQGIADLSVKGAKPLLMVPEGYDIKDVERYLAAPLRKRLNVKMLDTASFIAYLKKHGDGNKTVVYVDTNFEEQRAKLTAVVDDFGKAEHETSWREHIAEFSPTKTVEWKRWNAMHGKAMTQLDFAQWIEENMPDIASGIEGMPTGTEMLKMATQFEATAEKQFKQKVNLQGGGINLEYVNTDDAATVERMKVFDRFALGIKTFIGGDPYRVDARLRYRQNSGKLSFYFELIRADRVYESAIKDEIAKISEATGYLLLTGSTATA